MSKATKTRNGLKRREEKRKRKSANIARFESYIGTSANKKKKGGVNVRKRIPGHPHTSGHCGNVGCRKCFPELN